MASHWEQVERIFRAVLEAPPQDRPAVLERECGPDAGLRAEVDSLLACDGAAPADFLDPPSSAAAALGCGQAPPGSIAAPVGQRIGRYAIVRVIASGGMGTVYEAIQDEPHRTVALKVMHRHVSSRSALRRFRLEAELLGRLDHPHVAHIYEAGLAADDGGVPYFAMEYVPGARPITRYAAETGLSLRARVGLFAQVCDAVHHGHQKGVIHRDLKPGNILVSEAGVPKVIDFGVARVTDLDVNRTSDQTATLLIGTVQYMSPEQCAGDPHAIDTRSDVYTLGVVLYELLTGALPYAAGGVPLLSAMRCIQEAAPRRPSELDRRLRGDLDAILLKALAKDREQRYTSAAALADDLRRYLRGELIEARAPNWSQRAARWAVPRTRVLGPSILGAFAGACLLWWWVGVRPGQFVVVRSGGGRTVAMVSVLDVRGRVRQAWTDPPRIMQFADSVPTRDGRRLDVIGFASNDPQSNALEAYDLAESLERPVWSRTVDNDKDIPEEWHRRFGYRAGDFGVSCGLIADVFGAPGDEIIAAFQHRNDARSVIRIYDQKGTRLWQRWVPAQIHWMYWMSEPRQLVCSGLYIDRGLISGPNYYHPLVVLAVSPDDDPVPLCITGDQPDGACAPSWFKYVWPPKHRALLLGTSLSPPPQNRERRVNFAVTFQSRDVISPPGFGWVLDATGSVVDENDLPKLSTVYEARTRLEPNNPDWLPPPEDWQLVDPDDFWKEVEKDRATPADHAVFPPPAAGAA